jgi:hypothetical protein
MFENPNCNPKFKVHCRDKISTQGKSQTVVHDEVMKNGVLNAEIKFTKQYTLMK